MTCVHFVPEAAERLVQKKKLSLEDPRPLDNRREDIIGLVDYYRDMWIMTSHIFEPLIRVKGLVSTFVVCEPGVLIPLDACNKMYVSIFNEVYNGQKSNKLVQKDSSGCGPQYFISLFKWVENI